MLLQGLVVDQQTFARRPRSVDPFSYLIKISDRTDAGGRAARQRPRPCASSRPQRCRADGSTATDIAAQLDQMVYLLYALLAMSVVISLFGIANCLFLSIHERTREFGLLRAIGATGARSAASSATRA